MLLLIHIEQNSDGYPGRYLMVLSWGCPGFVFLGLLLTLLCPKQSGFNSPGIPELPMIPHFGQDLIFQMVSLKPAGPLLEYGTLWLDCRVAGPLSLVPGRQHGQCADSALRMDKIHCCDLTQKCLSELRKEAILSVSVVVIVRVAWASLPQPWRTITITVFICSDSFQPDLKG